MRENSKKFDRTGIVFPVSSKQIDRFEKQSPYKINVFNYKEERGVYPLRSVKEYDPNAINVLLI